MLAACSPITALNALIPAGDVVVERGIAYGGLARQKLDVYVPAEPTARRPIIVFFYGGGWKSGERDDYFFAGEAFASRGFLCIVPDYRLYPEATYPAFIEDGAAVVQWVRAEAARWGGDTDHLHLVGHSAGAYIGAMLLLDKRWLGRWSIDPGRDVRAGALLAGPYDFLPIEPAYQPVFGPPDQWPQTQPITHVDGSAPPLLLLTDIADTTVKPRNSERLAERIRASGGRVELKTYDNLGHILLVAALAKPFRPIAPVLDDVARFLRTA